MDTRQQTVILEKEGKSESKEIRLESAGGTAFSNFFDSIKSKDSQEQYMYQLNAFAAWLRTNRNLVIKSAEDLMTPASKEGGVKVIEGWINDYLMHHKRLGKSWGTLNVKRSALFLFFEQNEVDITSSFKKRLKKKFPEKKSNKKDRPYLLAELRQMIRVATIRWKVIVLMCVATGMRRGGLAGLTWGDAEKVTLPKPFDAWGSVYIFTVYPGTEDEYRAASTPECTRAVDEYKAYLIDELEMTLTPDTPFIINERELVPKGLTSASLGRALYEFLVAHGLKKPVPKKKEGESFRCNRGEVYLFDGFRKYWDTEMIRSHADYFYKEELMGHDVGLDEWYSRLSINDLLTEYVKAIPALTVTEEARKELELTQQVKNIEGEQAVTINKLEQKVDQLTAYLARIGVMATHLPDAQMHILIESLKENIATVVDKPIIKEAEERLKLAMTPMPARSVK